MINEYELKYAMVDKKEPISSQICINRSIQRTESGGSIPGYDLHMTFKS